MSGQVDGHLVEVGREDFERLGPKLSTAVHGGYARGETVVVVRRDDSVVGVLAVTTPLRPEAAATIDHLSELGLPAIILSGDSAPAVDHVAAQLGITDARSALSPSDKVAALVRQCGPTVSVCGWWGTVSTTHPPWRRRTSGVPSVAVRRRRLRTVTSPCSEATSRASPRRSGWPVHVRRDCPELRLGNGVNLAALPLAAFGLLDPLVAAVAMGLSSVLVVLNSLRLARLGRRAWTVSLGRAGPTGRLGVVLSVLLPVVLFAGLTVVSQVVSPARGQALLPQLPSVVVTQLPDGGSVDSYFDPGAVGVNQWHLIFSGTPAQLATVHPLVVAGPEGTQLETLRQLKVSPGHFSEIVVLEPGTWRFVVTTPFGRGPSRSPSGTPSAEGARRYHHPLGNHPGLYAYKT